MSEARSWAVAAAAAALLVIGYEGNHILDKANSAHGIAVAAKQAAQQATALQHSKDTAAFAQATAALNKATTAEIQSAEANNRVQVVQESRLAACNDTNGRHKATIKYIDHVFVQAREKLPGTTTRAELQSLRTSEEVTKIIINKMLPYHNCATYVVATR